MSTDGMRSVDPAAHRIGVADGMMITSIPEQTRTMVRLTSFETGNVVLVDPEAVIKVDTWNGTEPRTVIHVKDVYGPTTVRETPTEVHNLLMRAGVRIIGADDDRGIRYGEFIAQMSRTVDIVQDCADCEFELSKCTCSDMPPPPPASALDTIVTPDRAQPWLCDQCGHVTDECIAKGACDRSIVPPPAPAPGKGAR